MNKNIALVGILAISILGVYYFTHKSTTGKITFNVGIENVPDSYVTSDGSKYWSLYYWDPVTKIWSGVSYDTTEAKLKVSSVNTGGAIAVRLWNPSTETWEAPVYSDGFNPVNGGVYTFDYSTKIVS